MKNTLAFIAICLAGAACEAKDEPLSYSTYGVGPNDTLALRANPSATAQKLGDIPHDASDLHASGNTTAAGDWAEIEYHGRRGWVNSRYLAFGASSGKQLPALLNCSGTEPFWAINLAPGRANADLNFLNRRFALRITRAASAMNRTDIWIVKSRDARTEISLIVHKESCSDGMSDRNYPYSAVALVPGADIVAGCCAQPGAQ